MLNLILFEAFGRCEEIILFDFGKLEAYRLFPISLICQLSFPRRIGLLKDFLFCSTGFIAPKMKRKRGLTPKLFLLYSQHVNHECLAKSREVFSFTKTPDQLAGCFFRVETSYSRISRTVYSDSPAGVSTVKVSPSDRPRKADPNGDSCEIFPSDGLASATPTMVNTFSPNFD